ncbi:MAG: polysaccharide deacetylase family protein [Ktedonobacterales bacterium]
MRARTFLSGCILAFMLSMILSSSYKTAGAATPDSAHTDASRVISPGSAEITKVVLDDTSIDAPALWTTTSGTVRSVLAWTGTDASHRLNVMTTAIGTKYGNKVTLSDTSFTQPAVTRTPNGKVAIAWSGSDAGHTLNVLYDVYGARVKLTLWGETSSFKPALAASTDGALVLAWTGMDSGRRLNLLNISTNPPISRGWKATLWTVSGKTGPNLSFEASRSEYILSWAAVSPANQIAFARSSDGRNWTTGTALAEQSDATPSLMGIVGNYYTMPPHYVAWTGIDPGHSLNFQYTRSFPGWPDPMNTKVVLAEQAYQGPELGFISGPSLMLMTWTGVDAAHHLNVAVLTPMSPSPCALPGITPVTPRAITQGTSGRKEVALTFDAGGAAGNPASLLDTLKSEAVPATWFFTAEWAQAYPNIVARAHAQGYLIANHTVDHPDLVTPARSDNFICYQLGLGNQIVVDRAGISGTRPYFRPPYGSYNTQVLNRAAGLGYYLVMWSLNTHDDQDSTTASQIVNTVKSELAPGKIILMHGGSAHEPEALSQVIQYIKSQGYSIVTLDQLLAP